MKTANRDETPRQRKSSGFAVAIITGTIATIIGGIVLLSLEYRTDFFQQTGLPPTTVSFASTTAPSAAVATIAPLEAHVRGEPTLNLPTEAPSFDLSATLKGILIPTTTPGPGVHSIMVPLGRNDPSVDPVNQELELDIFQGGRPGMRVNLAFSAYNLKGVPCVAAIYLFHPSGEILTDENESYSSESGQVSVGTGFTPAYPGAAYDDLEIFLPYKELHVEAGTSELLYCAHLYVKETGSPLARFDCRSFQVTR